MNIVVEEDNNNDDSNNGDDDKHLKDKVPGERGQLSSMPSLNP